MEQMEPILRQGLETLGLPTDAIPQLQQYAKLLLETNKVMNLTAITDPKDVATLHFLDCAALLTLEDFRDKTVVDVGTGAGFPGLPLRILEPTIRLTLLDSLGKRVQFPGDRCARTWALRTWPASTAGRRNLPRSTGEAMIWPCPGR